MSHSRHRAAPSALLIALALCLAAQHILPAHATIGLLNSAKLALEKRGVSADVGIKASPQDLIPADYREAFEEHEATTSDGFILKLHRIAYGRDVSSSRNGAAPKHTIKVQEDGSDRPAVLLQHGLLESSCDFMVLGDGEGLAFLLADAGFDVWMGNSRGNVFSRKHTTYDITQDAFWAFSFDEMAEYDLPAMLDYIQQVTGQERISYVGFSQGSTVALAALSSQPELAQRLKAVALMGPVSYMTHLESQPLKMLASLNSDLLFTLLGVHEFLPSKRIVQLLEGQLCYLEPHLCLNILAAIAGFDGGHVNATKLPMYVQYTPAGTSVQNMAHWAQWVRETRFRTLTKYDYGRDCSRANCNRKMYGQDTPPTYDMGAIQGVPMMLLSGGKDKLADSLDVEYLREALTEGVVQKDISLPDFEHLDFVWGEPAPEKAYRPLIDWLLSHEEVRSG